MADAEKSRAAAVDGRTIGTTALVVVPVPPRGRRFESATPNSNGADPPLPPLHSPEDRRAEAIGLAHAIDLQVLDGIIVPLATPRPATLLGKGKIAELKTRVEQDEITLVVVDHTLSPVQQRNLENELGAKVLDRTGLILEIFGRRARTREAVKLCHPPNPGWAYVFHPARVGGDDSTLLSRGASLSRWRNT